MGRGGAFRAKRASVMSFDTDCSFGTLNESMCNKNFQSEIHSSVDELDFQFHSYSGSAGVGQIHLIALIVPEAFVISKRCATEAVELTVIHLHF